jgi:hypothetical protein
MFYSKVYSEEDLPRDILDKCLQYPRGFGYWLWKPVIILNEIKISKQDDVILYIDGRSHFIDKSLDWLEEFLIGDYDIGLWELSHLEKNYTSQGLLSMLSEKNEFYNTKQFAATFVLIRVNERTTDLITQWCQFLIDNFDLYSDNALESKNYNESFVENRHDQSVLSLLVKNKIKLNLISPFIISTEMFLSKNTILTHYKPHKSPSFSYELYLKTHTAKIHIFFLRLARKVKRFMNNFKSESN